MHVQYNPFFGGFLSFHFSQDISISVTCFITASVHQRQEVCNASFQWCGKDVAVISRFKDSKIFFDLN